MSETESRLIWLLEDYQRISMEQACRSRVHPENLLVWVRRDGSWRRMPDVEKVWQAAQRAGLSFCHFLVRKVFKLTGLQYAQVQAQFGPNPRQNLVGIYRKVDENGTSFVIVMDLSGYSKVSLAGAGIATAAALAALAYGVSRRQKHDSTVSPRKNKQLAEESEVSDDLISQRPKVSKTPQRSVLVLQQGQDDQRIKSESSHLNERARSATDPDLQRLQSILNNVWRKFDQVDWKIADNSAVETQKYLANTMKTVEDMESNSERDPVFMTYSEITRTAISIMFERLNDRFYKTEFQQVRKKIQDTTDTRQQLSKNDSQQYINLQFLNFVTLRKDALPYIETMCQRRKSNDPVLNACVEVSKRLKKNGAYNDQVDQTIKEIEDMATHWFEDSCKKSQDSLKTLLENEHKQWISSYPEFAT